MPVSAMAGLDEDFAMSCLKNPLSNTIESAEYWLLEGPLEVTLLLWDLSVVEAEERDCERELTLETVLIGRLPLLLEQTLGA